MHRVGDITMTLPWKAILHIEFIYFIYNCRLVQNFGKAIWPNSNVQQFHSWMSIPRKPNDKNKSHMKMPIAALSAMAKYWSQHKHTHTENLSVFTEHLLCARHSARPQNEYKSLRSVLNIEVILFWWFCLFTFNSWLEDWEVGRLGTIMTSRILTMICILPTKCVGMRFGR